VLLHYCRQKNGSYSLKTKSGGLFSVIHANQLTLFHTIKLNDYQGPVVQKKYDWFSGYEIGSDIKKKMLFKTRIRKNMVTLYGKVHELS